MDYKVKTYQDLDHSAILETVKTSMYILIRGFISVEKSRYDVHTITVLF